MSQKLKKLINKYVDELLVNKNNTHFIFEGIDINQKDKTVKVNLNHENGVDTSISNNPTETVIDGMKVYSIFKRKEFKYNGNNYDGNPLVYALKNSNGWSISNYDKSLLLKQFNSIADKLPKKFDTLIKIPSSNRLNDYFMKALQNKIHFEHSISDVIFNKLSKEDVFENSVNGKNIPDDVFNELVISFNKMSDNFTFKQIHPSNRKYIHNVFDGYCDVVNYANQINGKDIVILDDVISTGSSITHYVYNIKQMFEPKSITVISLFSNL